MAYSLKKTSFPGEGSLRASVKDRYFSHQADQAQISLISNTRVPLRV